MNNAELLRQQLEQQFIDKSGPWLKFVDDVNTMVVKFNAEINKKLLYTYDELCKAVMEYAVQLVEEADKEGKFIPLSDMLKKIYKHLVIEKLKQSGMFAEEDDSTDSPPVNLN